MKIVKIIENFNILKLFVKIYFLICLFYDQILIKSGTTFTRNGILRFINNEKLVIQNSARSISEYIFRVTVENNLDMINLPFIITDNPIFLITFPAEFPNLITSPDLDVYINEFHYSSDNNAVKTLSYSTALKEKLGRIIVIGLKNLGLDYINITRDFAYWEISIKNVRNPPFPFSTNTDYTTTGPFSILLTNDKFDTVLSTYQNLNNLSTTNLSVNFDDYIKYNRGIEIISNTENYLLDVIGGEIPNSIILYPGRFMNFVFTIIYPTQITTSSNIQVKLNDSAFQLSESFINIYTSLRKTTNFYLGCPCGTYNGKYIINFITESSTNSQNILTTPILVTLLNDLKGSIYVSNNQQNIPNGGTGIIFLNFAEPNVDELVFDLSTLNSGPQFLQLITNKFRISQAKFSSTNVFNKLNPYSVPIFLEFKLFTLISLNGINFKISAPSINICYNYDNSNELQINLSGQLGTIDANFDYSSSFKYSTSDSDITLIAKNAIKYTYNSNSFPYLLFCELACCDNGSKTETDIIEKSKAYIQTSYNKYFVTKIENSNENTIIFENLLRGKSYNLNCVVTTLNSDPNSRSSKLITIPKQTNNTNLSNDTTNILVVPAKSILESSCFDLTFPPSTGNKKLDEIITLCQDNMYSSTQTLNKKTSYDLWNENGCPVCTNGNFSIYPKYMDLSLFYPQNSTNIIEKNNLCFIQNPNCLYDFNNNYLDIYMTQNFNRVLKTLNVDNSNSYKIKIPQDLSYFKQPIQTPNTIQQTEPIIVKNYTSDIGLNSTIVTNELIISVLDKNISFLLNNTKEISNLAEILNDKITNNSISSTDIQNLTNGITELMNKITDNLIKNPKAADKNSLDIFSTGILFSVTNSLLLSSDSGTGQIKFKDGKLLIEEGNSSKVIDPVKKNPEGGLLEPIQLQKIKNQVETISNLIIKNQNFSKKGNFDIEYKSPQFGLYFFQNYSNNQQSNTSIEKGAENSLLSNRKSIIIPYECMERLKKFSNISNIGFSQIEWNPQLNSFSSFAFVTYNLYDPITFQTMNIEQYCKDSSLTAKIPIRDEIDKKFYEQFFINNNFNIYNGDDQYYNDYCIPLRNLTSEGDILLDVRREKIFKNISYRCQKECEFEEIDKENYMICKCLNTTQVAIATKVTYLHDLAVIQKSLLSCILKLNWDKLKNNIAFYLLICLIVLMIILIFLYDSIYKYYLNKKDMDQIILEEGKNYIEETGKKKVNDEKDNHSINDYINYCTFEIAIDFEFDEELQKNSNISKKNDLSDISKKIDFLKINPTSFFQEWNKKLSIPKNRENNQMINDEINTLRNENLSKSVGENNSIHLPKIKKDKQIDFNNEFLNCLEQSNYLKLEKDELQNRGLSQSFNNCQYSNLKKENINKITNKNVKKNFSIMDYHDMKHPDIKKSDERTLYQIYCNYIYLKHPLINSFMFLSYSFPFRLRITNLFFQINLNFLLNALLFFESMIRERNDTFFPDYYNNSLYYTIKKEITKSLYTVLISLIVPSSLSYFVKTPDELKLIVYKALQEKNRDRINEAKKKIRKEMRIRYIIYYILTFSIILFNIIYCIIFCSIYKSSGVYWAYGGLLSIFISFIYKLIQILFLSIFRLLMKKYGDKCCVYFVYSILLLFT